MVNSSVAEKILMAVTVSWLLPSLPPLLCYHVGPSRQPLPLGLLQETPNWSSLAFSLAPSQPSHSPQRRDHSHNKWPAGSYVVCPTSTHYGSLALSPVFSLVPPLHALCSSALFLCSFSSLCVFAGICRLELVASPS